MVDVMPEFIVMHSTPVRVELRLHRATENEDEEDADESSSISEGTLPALVEEWESWYPQEWVGWIMYGVPSENPTDHWVHQPTSEGPTDSEHFFYRRRREAGVQETSG